MKSNNNLSSTSIPNTITTSNRTSNSSLSSSPLNLSFDFEINDNSIIYREIPYIMRQNAFQNVDVNNNLPSIAFQLNDNLPKI